MEFFSRPYRYFQVFHPKINFLSVKSLHLFLLANFLCPTFIQSPMFIPCPTFIPEYFRIDFNQMYAGCPYVIKACKGELSLVTSSYSFYLVGRVYKPFRSGPIGRSGLVFFSLLLIHVNTFIRYSEYIEYE